jgi:hypothetical protein
LKVKAGAALRASFFNAFWINGLPLDNHIALALLNLNIGLLFAVYIGSK